MEPDGDPEARIRELERPLADLAQSSELGTRPYAATPAADVPAPGHPYASPPNLHQQAGYPYGAPGHGSPYHRPPQRGVRKRSPVVWLIPLVLGLVSVGTVGSIVFANLAEPDRPSPARPAAPGISDFGPVDAPEVGIDPTEIEIPFSPTEGVVTVGAGDTLSFGGIEQNKTVVCNQGSVNISGMTNTIEIRGDCDSVSVSGMNNILALERAQSITASGFDNRVTYRAGAPQVSNSGSGNVIEQG